MRQKEIETQLRDPHGDYLLEPTDYGSEGLGFESLRLRLLITSYLCLICQKACAGGLPHACQF